MGEAKRRVSGKAIRAYVAERNEVLLSLDSQRVADLFAKQHPTMPRMEPHIAEIAMHKARLVVTTFPETEKEISRQWLLSRGYDLSLFETASAASAGGGRVPSSLDGSAVR